VLIQGATYGGKSCSRTGSTAGSRPGYTRLGLLVTDDPRTLTTTIVAALGDGDGSENASAEQLMPLVYDELRRVAGYLMGGERPGHTLQATALVNEAYLRLVDASKVNWKGRTHFFAVGANMMRRLLVDHARAKGREKRGGDWQKVTLSAGLRDSEDAALDVEQLLSLDTALTRLADLDPRQARIVTLRFFGGLTVDEVADVIGLSARTVAVDWRHARAWLRRELESGGLS